jgi:hypothetical protein
LLNQQTDKIIFASDDLNIHKEISKISSNTEVVFLEKMESLYCATDEAIIILNQINLWLKNLYLKNQVASEQIYWLYHFEGGETTQRILDSLLLRRSYLELINNHKPTKIIIAEASSLLWEDELLFNLATQINISVEFCSNVEKIKFSFKKKWAYIRPVIVGTYRTFRVFETKLKKTFNKSVKIYPNKFIAILLPSAEIKHHNHTIPTAKALSEKNYQCIIIGWRLGKSNKNIKSNSLDLIEIETQISYKNIFSAWLNTLKLQYQVFIKSSTFLQSDYNTSIASIRPILLSSMRVFIYSEFLERIMFSSGINFLFQKAPPIALRTFTFVLPLSVITFNAAKKRNQKLIAFYHGGWHYQLPDPISNHNQPIPRKDVLVFCSSSAHKQILISGGYSEKNIFTTGLNWIEPITKFKCKYTKNESRKILNLKSSSKFYILLDSNAPLRGYLSSREQCSVIINIVDFASKNKNVEILIKPHPSYASGPLEEIIKKYSLENVHLIDKSMLPYHAINASDLLITKFSTLAIEAMFLNVPTISIILDNENFFKCYGHCLEYHDSIQTMLDKISQLTKSQNDYSSWFKKMMKKRDEYFIREGITMISEPGKEIAEIIHARLLKIKSQI